MQTGMIGQPVLVAILKDPSWNGSSSSLGCVFAPGAFREDHDGNAVFDIINGGQDRLQTGF